MTASQLHTAEVLREDLEKMRYLVLWCISIPKDENGDAELDRAEMVYEPFPTFDAAVALAKDAIASGRDQFGAVEVVKQVMSKRTGRFEDAANLFVDDESHAYTPADLRAVDV